ncbi:MAG TPA: AMP-binding protein [Chloroflexota bacterium]|nr:AMP-binding protein [Chloroflexota bacterium]
MAATDMEVDRDLRAERSALEQAVAGRTICEALARMAAQRPDAEALTWMADGGGRQALTWRQVHEQVDACALGLRTLGVAPDTCALILTRNRPEHFLANHALLQVRGIPVGLYPELAPAQVAQIATHCAARVAVVEAAFLPLLDAIRADLPALEWVVVIGAGDGQPRTGVIGWEELLRRGREFVQRTSGAGAELSARPEDPAALIYTSGTSGSPKGVLLTHRAALQEVEMWQRTWMAVEAGDRLISYAAPAHVSAYVLALWLPPVCGTVTHLCPDRAALLPALRAVRPTRFFGPPGVWETLRATLETPPDSVPSVAEALWVGQTVVAYGRRGAAAPREQAQAYRALAPRRAALLGALGLEHCQGALVAGAPCPPELIVFFHALGLPLGQGWGMTETGGLAFATGPDPRWIGTVGLPMLGVEARLSPDGELLVRGGSLMAGYYLDPARTAEALDGAGWLHTGDLADVGIGGRYRIVGRKTDLIILASGKNVAPSPIEEMLTAHPLIGQACVVGEGQERLTALLVLAAPAERAADPAVLAAIRQHVAAVNARLSGAEQITGFTILTTAWSVAEGELTPMLKLKRAVIARKYAAAIAAMYA